MANVHQICIYECDSCGHENLIRQDVRTKDRIVCGNCGAKDKVEQITAPYRSGKTSITLESEAL